MTGLLLVVLVALLVALAGARARRDFVSKSDVLAAVDKYQRFEAWRALARAPAKARPFLTFVLRTAATIGRRVRVAFREAVEARMIRERFA